ncbi:hypothetical protein QWA68_016626 [Fusarium oxysporum]|nr:hypothetical protein QWA68_016626 [Fusarium oxysporum]
MGGLLRHYEKNKEHYSKPEMFDRRILHSIEMGWFILDKYYTMTEDALVYAAALLLDPSKRIRYIERHWPDTLHMILHVVSMTTCRQYICPQTKLILLLNE